MHGSVDEDGWLGSRAAATPEMNTREYTTLDRSTSGDDLRLGRESSLEVSQERQVVGVRMVSREPRLSGNCKSFHQLYARFYEG